MTTTYTRYFRFGIPDFLSQPWHAQWQELVREIDRVLYGLFLSHEATVWANSHHYLPGQITIDITDGTFWVNLVDHTSSATPATFPVERATYPLRWAPIELLMATEAEALAGVRNDVAMSPLRTKQAIDAAFNAHLNTGPIVIFMSGQSNFTQEYTQLPGVIPSRPTNAHSWKYGSVYPRLFYTDGATGIGFSALRTDEYLFQEGITAEVAKLEPWREVYSINVSIGGIDIRHWNGTAGPDMRANIERVVNAALAAIGATKITHHLRWQGENQGDIDTFVADMETFWTWLETHSWYDRNTPSIIFGIAPNYHTNLEINVNNDIVNAHLREFCAREPNIRKFIYTPDLLETLAGTPKGDASVATTDWVDKLHVSLVGYKKLETTVARAILYGSEHPPVIDDELSTIDNSLLSPSERNMFEGGDFGVNVFKYGIQIPSAAELVANPTLTIARGRDLLQNMRWLRGDESGFSTDVGTAQHLFSRVTQTPNPALLGYVTTTGIRFRATTADAVLGDYDYYGFEFLVRGDRFAHMGWGTNFAKPVTVSFMVSSAKTGLHYMALQNHDRTRSFVCQYIVNTANTPERKVVQAPGDIIGTWRTTSTTWGLRIVQTLGISINSPKIFTSNQWNISDVRGSGAINIADTLNNDFIMWAVQVERGSGASPFNCVSQTTIQVVRRQATSDVLFCADVNNGDDRNFGQTTGAGNAFKTIQKAVDEICSLDLGNYVGRILLADGNYPEAVILRPFIGSTILIFSNNVATPTSWASTKIEHATLTALTLNNSRGWQISGIKLAASAANGAQCISASGHSQLQYGNCEFGTANTRLFCSLHSELTQAGDVRISGNANRHWHVTYFGAIFDVGGTNTHVGSPAHALAYGEATDYGLLACNAKTYSGAVGTSVDVVIKRQATIYTNNAHNVPGSGGTIEGTTGGQYL